MYEESDERIDAELDIVRMLRDLRNAKILLSNTMMDKATKFDIAHNDKNLIRLDTSDEEEDESEEKDPVEQIENEVKDKKASAAQKRKNM